MTKNFKIWDLENKRWVSQNNIYVNGFGQLRWVRGTVADFMTPNQFVICHAIGKKDKNNVDIYENYIVECFGVGSEMWDGSAIMIKAAIGKVVWEPTMFNLEPIKKGVAKCVTSGRLHEFGLDHWDGIFNMEDIVVIGNIFENPELLEE